MPIFSLLAMIAAALAGFGLTQTIRHNAARLGLVQIPNHRSSHTIPTPAGGGAAIAVVGAAAGLVAAGFGQWEPAIIAAFSTALAVVGYIDDVLDISARLRLALQILLCAGLACIFYPDPALLGSTSQVPLTLLLAVALTLSGVWWINLYNFMDGIDGLAGSQAVAILCCAFFLMQPLDSPFGIWIASTIGATAGFLILNWPPARIFMGDVGSNFLAVIMLGIALYSGAEGVVSYGCWAILAAVFVSDASVTLLRRMLAGQRWFAAHRSHAYQHLSRRWGHRLVTLLYLAVTIFWCMPLALWVNTDPALTLPVLALAYVPLLALVFVAKAGDT